MDNMLNESGNEFMRPLHDFRNYLLATYFDLSKRAWIGRTISTAEKVEIARKRRSKLGKKAAQSIPPGYIAYGPDRFSSETLQDLLRFALTIDIREAEEAETLGIAPRFQIVSPEALIAIDAQWSAQAVAAPFSALKIYTEIRDGARYDVPQNVEIPPKMQIPETRYIYVGSWDGAQEAHFTGLRDPLAEMTTFDPDHKSGCMGTTRIKTKGGTKVVLDVETADCFEVDPEGAALVLELEADRLVSEYHGPDALRPVSIGGNAFSTTAYRYYVTTGVIAVPAGMRGKMDEILRRSSFLERVGLAGYNYDREAAYRMSVSAEEIPPYTDQHEAERREKVRADAEAIRDQRRAMLRAKGITLGQLYREWSPNVDWRRLARMGAVEGGRIPAYCARALRAEAEAEVNRQIQQLTSCNDPFLKLKAEHVASRHNRKAWARWFRTDHFRLARFLHQNPEIAKQVGEYRRTKRIQGMGKAKQQLADFLKRQGAFEF